MELSEIKEMMKKELQEQRDIGLEHGYSVGESEGIKQGLIIAQCRLLHSNVLTEQQIKEIFNPNEEAMNKIENCLNNPDWLIENL
ncbi:MAG: hypothetical protein K6F88_07690 [Ruminococcus sp.]|nr:hypothetical protein [Ruminococcus sp.]